MSRPNWRTDQYRARAEAAILAIQQMITLLEQHHLNIGEPVIGEALVERHELRMVAIRLGQIAGRGQ